MLRKCFGIIKGKRSADGRRQDKKVDSFNAMQKPGLIRIATLSGFAVSGIAIWNILVQLRQPIFANTSIVHVLAQWQKKAHQSSSTISTSSSSGGERS